MEIKIMASQNEKIFIERKVIFDIICYISTLACFIFIDFFNVTYCTNHINDKSFDLKIVVSFIIMFINIFLSFFGFIFFGFPNTAHLFDKSLEELSSFIIVCVKGDRFVQSSILFGFYNTLHILFYGKQIFEDKILTYYFVTYVIVMFIIVIEIIAFVIHAIKHNLCRRRQNDALIILP
jgi:hypothetical protein